MRTRAPIALLPLACLLGCGLPYTIPTSANSPSTPLSGYWQFQTGNSVPPGAVLFSGAFLSQDSRVLGIFSGGIPCSPSVHFFTGAIDSSGNLTLAAPFAGAQLQLSPDFTSATGTVGGGGDLCQIAMEATVTGSQIATVPGVPLTGTFAGSVAEGTGLSGGPPSVSLVLTQSSTPLTGGLLPLIGTLTFTNGSCIVQAPLTGTLNGFWINLASFPATGTTPAVGIVAATNPDASQILAGNIGFLSNPCSSGSSSIDTYLGTLTRQ